MPQSIAELEARLVSAQNLHEQIDALNALAYRLMDVDNRRLRDLSQRAYKLAQVSGSEPYHKGVADSLINLAHYHVVAGTFDVALAQIGEALALYEALNHADHWMAHGLYLTGLIHFRLGDFTSALEHYLRMFDFAEHLDDDYYRALALRNIGSVYASLNEYDQTLDYYNRALIFYDKLGDTAGVASIYNNLSVLYRDLKDPITALMFGKKGLALFETLGHVSGLSRAHANISELYLDQHDFEQAKYHLSKALIFNEQSGGVSGKIGIFRRYSMFYSLQGEQDRALEFLNQALSLAESTKQNTVIAQCHRELSELYEQLGEFQQALTHYKLFHEINEKLTDEQTMVKFRNLESVHKAKQALAEADLLRRLRDEDRRYFERLSQMKDDFISAATHDLKNPLASINLAAFMLRRHGITTDERGENLLKRIESDVHHMRDLISDLLDLAKLETGRALTPEKLDITRFLKETFDLFRATAEYKRIQFGFHAEVTELRATFDPRRLRQVVENLLSNAVKYTQDGGWVQLSVEHTEDEVIVRVRDNGLGIPDEALPRLFEPFYRVPDERTQTVEGTGLGLAIVKSIVEQHNGKIWVESQVGAGSIFTFTLPLAS